MLNPALNRDELHQAFQNGNRAQVRDVLETEQAQAIVDALSRVAMWNLVYLDPMGQLTTLTPAAVQAMSQLQRNHQLGAIHDRAKSGVQLFYNRLPLVPENGAQRNPESIGRRIHDFLQSATFLDFARELTGDPQITRVSVFADRFVAGHYVRQHNHVNRNRLRRFGFVINLTQQWEGDCGGMLQLHDDSGRVIESYAPDFNTLVVFKAPTEFSVSYVAPYSQYQQYRLSGWFLSDVPLPEEVPAEAAAEATAEPEAPPEG